MSKALKILIIDNNREPRSYGAKNIHDWCLRMAPMGSEVRVRRAPDQDLPGPNFQADAIVVSGSITSSLDRSESWIPIHDDYLSHQLERGTPILGICYGHQALARCLAHQHQQEPKLRKAPNPELGWCEIQIREHNQLTEGLPESFITYQSHYEEVEELPPGCKWFAESSRCQIQGFEVIGKPVFGIQFHPEYGLEEVERYIQEKIKKKIPSEWIFRPGQGKKVYKESVGITIFGNFFKLAGV